MWDGMVGEQQEEKGNMRVRTLDKDTGYVIYDGNSIEEADAAAERYIEAKTGTGSKSNSAGKPDPDGDAR